MIKAETIFGCPGTVTKSREKSLKCMLILLVKVFKMSQFGYLGPGEKIWVELQPRSQRCVL